VGPCQIFPPTFEYNKPITNYSVDPLNNCYLNRIISNAPTPYIRLDMGVNNSGYGIPWGSGPPSMIGLDLSNGYDEQSDCYNTSNPTQLLRPCCTAYGNCLETWRAPYNNMIEGQDSYVPNPPSGDRHSLYVDTTNCLLYETFATAREGGNKWQVGSSAVFDLNDGNFPQRPAGWTSADAAGLPIFPGLMRIEEFNAGAVNHALRFTAEKAQMAYVSPAAHLGTTSDPYDLPYGIRLRLKASFDITPYTPQAQILLTTLKTYGMFFADQGTGFYIQGTANNGWTDQFFGEINQAYYNMRVHIDNFEVVKMPTSVFYGYTVTPPTCNQVLTSTASSPASMPTSALLEQAKEVLP